MPCTTPQRLTHAMPHPRSKAAAARARGACHEAHSAMHSYTAYTESESARWRLLSLEMRGGCSRVVSHASSGVVLDLPRALRRHERLLRGAARFDERADLFLLRRKLRARLRQRRVIGELGRADVRQELIAERARRGRLVHARPQARAHGRSPCRAQTNKATRTHGC
eukprot:2599220-Pleurochrysis_carterae.AAC.1